MKIKSFKQFLNEFEIEGEHQDNPNIINVGDYISTSTRYNYDLDKIVEVSDYDDNRIEIFYKEYNQHELLNILNNGNYKVPKEFDVIYSDDPDINVLESELSRIIVNKKDVEKYTKETISEGKFIKNNEGKSEFVVNDVPLWQI